MPHQIPLSAYLDSYRATSSATTDEVALSVEASDGADIPLIVTEERIGSDGPRDRFVRWLHARTALQGFVLESEARRVAQALWFACGERAPPDAEDRVKSWFYEHRRMEVSNEKEQEEVGSNGGDATKIKHGGAA
jgi:hypothetical protein